MAEFIEIDETPEKIIKSKAEKPEKPKPAPKKRGKLFNIPCPAMVNEQRQMEREIKVIRQSNRCSVDEEVKSGLKTTAINMMSTTFPDQHRRGKLKEKLTESQCINDYFDHRISERMLSMFNDHLKVAVVYAYNWFDVYSTCGFSPQAPPNPNPNANPVSL